MPALRQPWGTWPRNPPSCMSRNQSLPEDGDELLFSSFFDMGNWVRRTGWWLVYSACHVSGLPSPHPPASRPKAATCILPWNLMEYHQAGEDKVIRRTTVLFCPASQTSDKDAKRPGSADTFQCSCIDVQSAHLVDLLIVIRCCSPLLPITKPRSSKHTWLQGAAHSTRFPSNSKGCRRLWPRERMGALTVQRPEQLQRQYPC